MILKDNFSNIEKAFCLCLGKPVDLIVSGKSFKKGTLENIARSDFSFELILNTEKKEADVVKLPIPFSFDQDTNSILLDYRNIPFQKNTHLDSASFETLKNGTLIDKPSRFYDSILEVSY